MQHVHRCSPVVSSSTYKYTAAHLLCNAAMDPTKEVLQQFTETKSHTPLLTCGEVFALMGPWLEALNERGIMFITMLR